MILSSLAELNASVFTRMSTKQLWAELAEIPVYMWDQESQQALHAKIIVGELFARGLGEEICRSMMPSKLH